MTRETVIVGLVVSAAALYLFMPLFLPTYRRTQLSYRLKGEAAPCAPNAVEEGCGIGCAGCTLAQSETTQQS